MLAIVAVSANWAIGNNGGMLFNLKKDMQFFKEKTSGKVVVMGRKTLESFKNAAPLPNRTNIVLTRTNLKRQDIIQCHNLQQLAKALAPYAPNDVFNIGGSQVYSLLLPFCSGAYVTKVGTLQAKADSFFPNLDTEDGWHLAEEGPPIQDGGHTIKFCSYTHTAQNNGAAKLP